MKIKVVKSAVEAWRWIASEPHYEVSTIYHKTRLAADGRGMARTHIQLRNYHEAIRIPEKMRREVFIAVKPNPRPFDTRMYALKPRARKAIGL